MERTSRLPGFYKLPLADRRRELAVRTGVDDVAALAAGPLLDHETADHMSENVVGTHALPLAIGLNFQVNGRDFLVPMSVEEPSVVAAASNAARMVRAGGGFHADADDPIMIAQVQLVAVRDTDAAVAALEAAKPEIMRLADAAQPGLVARGGGMRGVEVRVLEPGMIVVHLLVDCRDAMGANAVNTIAEAVADRLAELGRADVGLRILSNLADKRVVRVKGRVPVDMLDEKEGLEVARGIVSASRFAELDPYRAATHNKGIMNGVDAVILACGNDWRGIEAGAHAYAARSGTYRPLGVWRLSPDARFLEGTLALPMAVGIVGGATRVHPGVRLALKILAPSSAGELGMVAAAVGLASNLAALRALSSEGIQRGHMSLHARNVARIAGATGELVERVAAELAALGDVRAVHAEAILARLRTAEVVS